MSALDNAVAAIQAGPAGPHIGAFFDFDGTLIDGYSVTAYFMDRLRQRQVGLGELADILRLATKGNPTEAEFGEFVAKSLGDWAGSTEEEISAIWARLWQSKIAATLFPEASRLVQAHLAMGHTVAIASSATRYQAAPAAQDLGITHLLCTQPMVRHGRLTGGIQGPTLWGSGKADAVQAFARAQRLDLAHSWGYANGNEDIAFLKSVGRATAVNPKQVLAQAAAEHGWPTLRFAPRKSAPWSQVARSALAYYALAATALGGLAYATATGKKLKAAELVASIGADAVLAIGGVDVEVQGEAHLWTHRPAVFMFNHQSKAEAYVLLSLIRRGATGVAKQEAAGVPVAGQILRALDVIFIDRADSASAISAMQPVVDRLKGGTSIVIAPEGTRSGSARLGKFKKGAFHIAMQAGVPIVPIVVRNAYEVQARDSLVFRPGTVQVCVLPPVDVSAWHVESLDEHVAEVRAMFQRTLDDWPEASAPRPAAHAAEAAAAAAPPLRAPVKRARKPTPQSTPQSAPQPTRPTSRKSVRPATRPSTRKGTA